MTNTKIKNSILSVLLHPNFKYMWLSQVFSQIALNMLTFALVIHLFDITGKATSISGVMISSAVAVAIFGPISGVLADRINYAKIMLATNFLRFLVVILLLFSGNNVLACLEIMFLISALSQIFTPAESSSVPLAVPKEELISANSVIMSTSYVTLLIGYSIAGPILALVGSNWLFAICAILYLAATWATKQLTNYDRRERKKITFESFAHGLDRVWEEIITSFKYLRGNKKILQPMLKLTIGWTVLGAFITLIPAYGESVLNINSKVIGPLVIAPAGLGMLLSTIFLNKKNSKLDFNRVINNGFLIASTSLLLFSSYYFYQELSFSRLIIFIILISLGFGCSLVQISSQTLLHLNSDEDNRGKIFGLSSMQLRLATSLPALFIGGISDLTSPLITMILLSITVFIYSMILLFE